MIRIRLILLFLGYGLIVTGQKINIASYNIRYDNRSDEEKGNGWKVRCPAISDLIRTHDIDVFGAQEVLNNQKKDLLNRLPEYASVGVGRDDGKAKGEFSPIFFKKDKFKLLKSGTFWLSPMDSLPNIGWDAVLPRICSWGRFQLKETNTVFWFFNLHMDHIGQVARLESAKLVLRKIREMCGKEPVILTGDFNMDQASEGYGVLAGSGTLNDACIWAAIRNATIGTFNDFDLNQKSEARIDHIFVSNQLEVLQFDILTDTYQADVTRLPSDHYPILAALEMKE